jgi:hypothetical protein
MWEEAAAFLGGGSAQRSASGPKTAAARNCATAWRKDGAGAAWRPRELVSRQHSKLISLYNAQLSF